MKNLLKRLFVAALAVIMAVSSVPVGIQVNAAEEMQQSSYYEDWNAAETAVRAACGIGDASKYTEVQVDLIRIFLGEWGDKAYAATTKTEADAVLADAVVAYGKLKIHDSAAMAEHAKIMKAREAASDECMGVLEANLANKLYTKASRTAYELEARSYLSKLWEATSYDAIDENVAGFESCAPMLVEYTEEMLLAKEEAKAELTEILEKEYENFTTIDRWYDKIDDADTQEEIDGIVQECKEFLAEYVNQHDYLRRYIDAKWDKITNYLDSFESELGNKFEDLETYVKKKLFNIVECDHKGSCRCSFSGIVGWNYTKGRRIKKCSCRTGNTYRCFAKYIF